MRSSLSRRVLLATAVWVNVSDVAAVMAEGEKPAHSVCRFVAKGTLSVCSMVDYMAIIDADDPTGTEFDSKAEFYYRNVDIGLQRFGCHAKNSIYGCDDCRGDKIPKVRLTHCDDRLRRHKAGLFNGHVSIDLRRCREEMPLYAQLSTETPFFSADIATCNKLDRAANRDRPSRPWPATFAAA
ncbi:hypothetical protein GN958_ATG21823 [Phytophthora infestans]|nr:hypothetical protein GN958_ATG21823 [Phytophthora infestans]